MKVVNEQKKISIAIATYNGGKYLREQLESLYSQTRIPNEVVVCDDNSIDNTVEILEEYKQRKGLKYYVNNPGLGVNKNFEKAIRLCTGDYIAICDQDDVWMPQKIEVSLRKLQEIEANGKPACISSRCHDMDADGNVKLKSEIPDTYGYAATIADFDCKSQGCSLMMNRMLLENLKSFPMKEPLYDGYIGIVAAYIGEKYNLGIPLMYYRHHANNVVAKNRKKSSYFVKMVNRLSKWKYARLTPLGRITTFKRIISEYKTENNYAKNFMNRAILYGTSSFIKRNIILWKMDEYSSLDKVVCFLEDLITLPLFFLSKKNIK